MGRIVVIALAAALLTACGGNSNQGCKLDGGTGLSTTAQWARFHADLANSGRAQVALDGSNTPEIDSFDTCGEAESRCKWRTGTGSSVSSSAAIDFDGSVYIGSSDTRFYALQPDGSYKWRTCDGGTNSTDLCETDDDCPGDPPGNCLPGYGTLGAITSTPAIDTESRVYFGSGDQSLYTLFGLTGEVALPRVILAGFLASSVALGSDQPNLGVAYLGSLTSGLFADCPNRILRWTSAVGPVRSSPAVGPDGTVYFTTTSTRLLASVDPENGQTNWTFTARAALNASPALAEDGTLYVGDTSGAVFAVGSDGTGIASLDLRPASIEASPAIGFDGTIFVATDKGDVFALDPNTLAIKTSFSLPTRGSIRSSPAVSMDGTVVFGSDDGLVYALEYGDSAFALRWTFATGGSVRSSPAIGTDGTIIVGSDDTYVYALRP